MRGLPRWFNSKEFACKCRDHRRCRNHPWVGKIPWRRKWQPTPVFFLGQSNGQRSLAGCRPWDWKESNTTYMNHIINMYYINYKLYIYVCIHTYIHTYRWGFPGGPSGKEHIHTHRGICIYACVFTLWGNVLEPHSWLLLLMNINQYSERTHAIYGRNINLKKIMAYWCAHRVSL